ncbi:ABC transporter permease [Xylocopilactobacillus apicola]|uniref:ABC transporter permease n=1 Tax=Xylocopilactobacillus apicola TaxID=2932184 RepID=A0AAU9DJP7_9LACO|nr:ABC transporter permease [Xylocopilactobacillus apicola]BDR58726.1 ABC transporter permease [Xylocopilactobacillus apicola]
MRIKKIRIGGIMIPLVSVFLGLLVGAVIMMLSHFNPIQNYINLFVGALGSPNAIGEVLRAATPLMLTALGFSVANSAGFFNVGLAGQALAGWLASVWFALTFSHLPGIILLPGSIIIGALAGAFWSGIAGFLRAYFGASEVITTIMLNYISLYGTNAIVKGSMVKSDADSTPLIPAQARLRTPFLEQLTQNSTFHWGIIISILMVLLVWFLMKKTTLGFEIRAVGMNEDASRYAGMSSKKTIISAMLISGALAGLGGAMEGLGNFQNIFVNTVLPDIGFDGMSVSLLATGNPIGIIFSALLFGILKIGGLNISINSTTPSEIVNIVIASVIFFVGANYIIRYWGAKMKLTRKNKVGDA